MSVAASPAPLNYLLQVTLLKTSNPAVSRLLSVPADDTFDHVGTAIEAAFEWYPKPKAIDIFPTFKIVHGNPLTVVQQCELPFILRIGLLSGTVDSPSVDIGYVKISQVFDDFRYSEKFMLYSYNSNDYQHSIQVVGRSRGSKSGQITCVGGQGYTTLEAWESCLLDSGCPSTWNVDLEEVCARVDDYLDSHERAAPAAIMSNPVALPAGDFIIQVTLLKTSNPVVSRTFSVPPFVTFLELHYTIEAAYEWSTDALYQWSASSPMIRVVQGNPFDNKNYNGADAILALEEDGTNDYPRADETDDIASWTVNDVLGDYRYREKFIIYDYDTEDDFPHVVQTLGRLPGHAGENIVCFGGQGHTALRTWGRKDASNGEFKGGPSSWEFDLDAVSARVASVKRKRLREAESRPHFSL